MTPPGAARVLARVQTAPRRAIAGLAAAALLAASLTAPAVAHPGQSRAPVRARPPLTVTIDTMSPSTVPRRGKVTLTGEIRNRSDSTWTDLQVFMFASDSPMTTSAELEEATASDVSLDVGARLTAPGQYDEVPDLAPGETTSYELTVDRADLRFDEPGVYWLGVHVLGTNEEGRAEGADGRARTFIPYLPSGAGEATLSLVLPLRTAVRRTTDGRVANPRALARRLGGDGRIGRLTDLGETAFDVPVTWVVDPALLDAARTLADGNPGFDLTPTEPVDGEPSPGEGSSPSPAPTEPEEATGTPDGTTDPEEELAELAAEAQVAEDWLTAFVEGSRDDEVLALPYGDVDVAALLRGNFTETFDAAFRLGNGTMEQLGVEADPVVAPLGGLLPNEGLDNLDPAVPVLLSEAASRTEATQSTHIELPGGATAQLASEAARLGGPGPNPPLDALALRQRIVAEAAVHALENGSADPLVVSLPDLWDPGAAWRSSSFFNGLDLPWLRTVRLSTARAMSTPEPYDRNLVYPRGQRRQELGPGNVLASQELAAAGDVLAALLTRNDDVDEQVGRAALLGSSVHARTFADRARARTRRISEQVHRQLEQVYVESSPLVTMSSRAGNFSVTVVNNLAEPVTVGIEARTGTDELTIRQPDLVSMGPGQRATVRLAVRARDVGVSSVRLVPTTEDGRPLGRSTVIKVRNSQVGLVIWVVMGTGLVVFVVALVARIVRRIRTRKRTPGPLMKDVSP